MIDLAHPDRIVVARNGSPIILGIGDGEMHVASDAAALVRYTRQVVHLDDGELATVRADGYRTFTSDARATTKTAETVEWTADEYERGAPRALHGQGDPRAARGGPARASAAGSTSASTPSTWAASTWTPGRPARSGG